MLKQRIITAIVLFALVGSCIVFLPLLALSLFFALIVLLAAWEWSTLAGLTTGISKSLFTLACAFLMLLSLWYSQVLSDEIDLLRMRDILGLACLWWSVGLLWVIGYPNSAALWRSVVMRMAMGFVTLVPAWLALVYIASREHGTTLLFILIAIVAAADIGAYFSGRAWGDKKLAPAVSPGKSWAGFWGGLVASSLLSVILWVQWGQADFSLITAISIVVVTSLASVLGDLMESMVKREQGVKDSGTILPGHGGIMDRVDSLTAATPVFALSLLLSGWQ